MADWNDAHGWVYEMYPLGSSVDLLGPLHRFKKLWDDKRNASALPAWRDFELEDLAEWYGWVSVEDVLPGEEYNSIVRLCGTNVTQLFGVDMTGKKTQDLAGYIYSKEDFEMSLEIVRNHLFRVCSGPLDWKHNFNWNPTTNYTLIQLPLADDGENVDKLLMLIQPLPASNVA